MDKSKLKQMKLGRTVLKRGTLKDPIFWRDGFGTAEQVKDLIQSLTQVEENLKKMKIDQKLAELKELGVEIPVKPTTKK